MTHSPSTDSRHIPWIDWLRFLSAFAVVLSHAHAAIVIKWADMAPGDKTPFAGAILAACSFGQEAVVAFFVMSGMLVGGRLLERVLDGTFEARRYFIDRLTRIYVPLVPALIFSVIVWAWLGNQTNLWEVLGNLVQLQGIVCQKFEGNRVLWSLAYEFWFYVMGGALGVICAKGGKGKSRALVALFACMGIFVLLDPIYLFCWIGGALSYACREQIVRLEIFIMGTLSLLLGLTLSSPVAMLERDGPAYRANFLLISLGFALFAIMLSRLRPGRLLGRWESLGTRLASGSYTLFLTHAPVILIYRHFNPEPNTHIGLEAALDSAVCLGSCCLVAWIFYHLFERHTASVRHFLNRRDAQGEIASKQATHTSVTANNKPNISTISARMH